MKNVVIGFAIMLLFPLLAWSRVENGVLLIIDNPELLEKIEESGFRASQMFEDPQYISPHNQAWAKKPYYKSIVQSLSKDLDVIKSKDKHLSVTMAKVHRLFDKRWFTSKYANYELVGVVNRLDRAPFAEDRLNNCGELRLIYRLAYKKGSIYTRLPMTFNVVFWADHNKCKDLAKKWLARKEPQVKDLKNLLRGPLNKKYFSSKTLKSVEVNLQSVRWPSTIRPDTGGHAEYLLRVFQPQVATKKLVLTPLENTPNLGKLKGPLKKQLIEYLSQKNTLSAYDAGVVNLPQLYLATKVTGVAFYGMSRLANRPFDQIATEKDFAQLPYSKNKLVKSPAGYLRRLNDMTCVGCHQSRSIAGFHFVGIDNKKTLNENAIKVSHSAHLLRDLPRRAQFVKDMARGRSPKPERGFAERAGLSVEGGYGDHCGRSNDPTFKSWSCKPGLICRDDNSIYKSKHIGTCLPKNKILSGDPCDAGYLTQVSNPHKDKLIKKKKVNCGEHRYCLSAGEGFPGGICFGECEDIVPGEACGAIAVGGFNSCLFANKLFTQCLADHTGPISMRACDENRPCRDDFICSKGKDGKGSCIPPYFLFQLRLDGHPKPI